MPLGKTTLVKGDMVIMVCKQGLIFTITIRLECPFVDVEHLWKVFSFPGYFLQRHVYFIFWSSFDNSPGYQIAALFSVGSMFNLCLLLSFQIQELVSCTLLIFMQFFRPRFCLLLMLPLLFPQNRLYTSVLLFLWV